MSEGKHALSINRNGWKNTKSIQRLLFIFLLLAERIVVKDKYLSIQVYKPSNPQAQMQEWMDAYLGAVATMLRSDTTIRIDGYNARWLTVVYPPQSIKKRPSFRKLYTFLRRIGFTSLS